MFKKLCLLSASLVLVGGTAYAEDPSPYNCDFSPSCEVAPGVYGAMASPVMSKFKLSIGGYIKFDYAHNTNATGPRAGAAGAPFGPRKDESIFSAKQSRFWMKVAGPTLLGAKTNGLIEADFYGNATGSTNETPSLRLRHAWLSADWTNTQILAGQFWDIFGPGTADTIDFFQGGPSGTPNAPRVPQLRLTQKLDFNKDNGLKLVLGLQNTQYDAGAAGATFASGAAYGSNGSVPNVAGQLLFVSKMLGTSPGMMGLGLAPLQVGVFGQYARTKLTTGGQVNPFGYGVYAFVPVLKSRDGKSRAMTLSLEAQGYQSRGMNVQLANAAGLAKATAGDERLARGFGYWGQLKFYPTQDLGITGGYEARHVSHPEDFGAASFERRNSLAYVNATYDLNAAIRVATEFETNVTTRGNAAAAATFPGQNEARNNMFRVAAYYFF